MGSGQETADLSVTESFVCIWQSDSFPGDLPLFARKVK